MEPWTSMITAMRTAGIKIVFQKMSFRQFKGIANDDKRVKYFLDLWEGNQGYILQDTYLPFVYACVIILSMTKNLNDKSYAPWIERRIKTFSGSIGDDYTPSHSPTSSYPLLVVLDSLYTFASANVAVRRELYLEIVNVAYGPPSFITSAFIEIHHMLRGHEMQHLILIDKFILEEHPEFLNSFLLRGFKARFKAAMSVLQKIEPEDRLYAKILLDKEAVALLNRKLFDHASTVATVIAQFKSDSYKYYYINNDEAHNRIKDIVTDYMMLRTELVGLSAGGSDYQKMTPLEKEQFDRKMLELVENRWAARAKESEESGGIVLPILENV